MWWGERAGSRDSRGMKRKSNKWGLKPPKGANQIDKGRGVLGTKGTEVWFGT